MRRKIEIHFENPSDFKAAYLNDFAAGGVFVPTKEAYAPGEPIVVYLCFREIPQGVPIGGTVAWRRPPTKWQSALQAGIGVRFDKVDIESRNFLISYSQGRVDSKRNQARRIPVELRVDFLLGDDWKTCYATNISAKGIFVQTQELFPLDALIQMKLYLTDSPPPPNLYHGRVAWQQASGPDLGVGVEFQFTSPLHRRKICQFVDRHEQMMIAELPGLARTVRSALF